MVEPATDPATLAERLHAAAIGLLRRLRRVDDGSGLSAPRLSVLSVLVFRGELSLGELAAAEQVSAPSMSRLVAALEAERLLQRRIDPQDGRGVRLRASGKGRRRLLQARERRLAQLRQAIATLTPLQQHQLASAEPILRQLLERLDQPVGAGAADDFGSAAKP